MTTEHNIFFNSSKTMHQIKDASVDLVVTSPPYPMIEMWDGIMGAQNIKIQDAFKNNQPQIAFELMHMELDSIWEECYRVMKEGSFLCINIGDATRTVNGMFQLYNNHSRIVSKCTEIGFTNLPNIIWRKQTNAPNKFMGSGMLPCGAYVTLEHEYILIFRKGNKREYKNEHIKSNRRKSAFFWEERNLWFSDVWDLKGTKQKIENSLTRERSAAFPIELPYRLINMYSQYGDVILDPFMGMGTTMKASMLLGRNSVGYEIDKLLSTTIEQQIDSISIEKFNNYTKERINNHLKFVNDRKLNNKNLKYYNVHIDCEVMTKQEVDMYFKYIKDINKIEQDYLSYKVNYIN